MSECYSVYNINTLITLIFDDMTQTYQNKEKEQQQEQPPPPPEHD